MANNGGGRLIKICLDFEHFFIMFFVCNFLKISSSIIGFSNSLSISPTLNFNNSINFSVDEVCSLASNVDN